MSNATAASRIVATQPVLTLRLYVTAGHTESVLRGPFTNAQGRLDGTGESYALIAGRHTRPQSAL